MFSKLLRRRPNKPTSSAPSRFRMEMLENRQMMAGDVAASVVNGNLYINEALGSTGLDNGVRIYQVSPGIVRVQGAEANNNDGSLSRINGQLYQDFAISGDLNVNLGAGNDRLHLGFDGGSSAPSFNNVNINMAAPDLVIAQKAQVAKGGIGGVGGAFDPPDADQFFGWGFNARGAVNVNTGVGNDWVFISNSFLGDGLGDDNLTINTGAGADTASIKGTTLLGNLRIQTYANVNENDADMVWMDSALDSSFNTRPTYVTGDVSIYTGGGADNLWLGDSTDPYFTGIGFMTNSNFQAYLGAGDDVVDISAAKFGNGPTHWSNLLLYTGAGADDVTVDFDSSLIDVGDPMPEINGSLIIQTYDSLAETDADKVTIPIGQVGFATYIWLGGGDDQFSLTAGNWGGYVIVDAGAGNDTGFAAGFLYETAEIRMGEGNDNMTIAHLRAKKLTLDGGAGVDSLRRLSPSAVDQLFQTGWEYINGRPQWVLDNVYSVQSATLAKH
ncbi:hypothetical protein [Lacipirellula parvula]|uniref:Uncharacterized protein n=1 Tax=Lacipirellula parvula TaxID=2650471 RepID=A0A5K7X9A8_9BACT|nr:hypothetical protein [Lacipirellula parvula]BBO30896.1 hypothetical protein PLANPX_0508 [Lacipirellula parvula]